MRFSRVLRPSHGHSQVGPRVPRRQSHSRIFFSLFSSPQSSIDRLFSGKRLLCRCCLNCRKVFYRADTFSFLVSLFPLCDRAGLQRGERASSRRCSASAVYSRANVGIGAILLLIVAFRFDFSLDAIGSATQRFSRRSKSSRRC